MAGPDRLHQLIHSLGRSEKRYFKLNAVQHRKEGKSNFIRLFEALDKMESFDAALLKQKFEGSSIGKNLASEKKQLYRLILKSMRSYQGDASPLIRIQHLLRDAEWLEKKGLYAQFARLLQRAKRLAKEYDQPRPLLDIVLIQLRATLHQESRNLQASITELLQEKDALVPRIAASERVTSLYYRFMQRSRAGRNEENVEAIAAEEAEFQAVMEIPVAMLSFEAQINRHFLAGLRAQEKRDRQTAFDMFGKAALLWRARQKLRSLHPNRYKITLSNYLASAAYLRRFDLFPEILQEIRSLKPASFNEEAEIFQNTYFFELVWKMNTGDFAEAEALVPAIEEKLQTYLPKINKARELGFFYNIAVLFFMREQWKQSLRWINRILHDERSQHRSDLQQFARIFFLLLHFELGNMDLLEYRVPATASWIKKNGKENGLPRIILPFLSSFLLRSAETSPSELWQELHRKLADWIAGLKGGLPIGTEECRLWTQSKVKGLSLETALRENLSTD